MTAYHITYYCLMRDDESDIDANSFDEALSEAEDGAPHDYDCMGIDHNPVHRIKVTDEHGTTRNYKEETITRFVQTNDYDDEDEEEAA